MPIVKDYMTLFVTNPENRPTISNTRSRTKKAEVIVISSWIKVAFFTTIAATILVDKICRRILKLSTASLVAQVYILDSVEALKPPWEKVNPLFHKSQCYRRLDHMQIHFALDHDEYRCSKSVQS